MFEKLQRMSRKEEEKCFDVLPQMILDGGKKYFKPSTILLSNVSSSMNVR